MIVKILASSLSFAGIDYNEKKNEQGKSELLIAENFNFPAGGAYKKTDYIKYMEMMANTNTAVKNIQFHAVVSCKGRESSPEQLMEIAQQYITKMGYANNPYLIYYHSDTENNHVHVVTPRVDKLGTKIDDSFERVRSQRIMNEIMNVDLKEKVNKDYATSLEYSFSTIQQYKLLLERQGWKVSEKDNNLYFRKAGDIQMKLAIDDIKTKVEQYSPSKERKKQITAILHKYKSGLNYAELTKMMKDKFGVELVFHTGKGHTTPYGYTIIDHPSKTIFKGGEIMDLKEMLSSPDKTQKMESCNMVINALLLDNKYTLEDLKKEMYKYGYTVSMAGAIGLKGQVGTLLELDKEVLREMRYNSRSKEANTFSVSSLSEAKVISRLYFVKVDDINIKPEYDKSQKTVYQDMMKSYLSNVSDVRQELSDKKISFVKHDGELFLVDAKNREIISSTDLGINLLVEQQGRGITISDSRDFENFNFEQSPDIARGVDIVDVLCGLLNQNMNAKQDPRKKRKKGQQNN